MTREAMFDIVLHEPEIPPNTGNLIRLAANTGAGLHLVRPLGFRLDARALKRAGLDYGVLAQLTVHDDWQACRAYFAQRSQQRMYALTTRATRCYADVRFQPGDVLVFGAETRGLPADVLEEFSPRCRLRLPMRPGNRSINLANAATAVVYEAWRQFDFVGADSPAGCR